MKTCFIGGTGLLNSNLFSGYKKIFAKNKFGKVCLYQKKNIFFIQRHEGGFPPHTLNYKAYIQALFDLGVRKIFSLNSVGALRNSLKVPSLMVPDDFVGLWNTPTFFDREISHVTPRLSQNLRSEILKTAKKLRIPTQASGVYFQTTGPRLETPAEIKLMANFADVVGMTMASEAILAAEKDIEIASLCAIDNYANGVRGKINLESIYKGAGKNQARLEKIIQEMIESRVKHQP